MTWVDPQLRVKRVSRSAWARARMYSPCGRCGVIPGDLWDRFVAICDGFNRCEQRNERYLIFWPFEARQWFRRNGFDPTQPLAVCDHIVPLWEGGDHCESNLQLLCRPCHREKTREEARRRARAPKKRFAS